ncbi:MAG: aspartate 1-decarboxylase [Desulfovibrio sp.]
MATRTFLSAKLHRATITEADLSYSGSMSIDTDLLKAAGILPYEQIDVYNVNNGARLTTYAIPGKKGQMCLNGAAARKGEVGDKVIIASFIGLETDEIAGHKPKTLIIGDDNTVIETLVGEVPTDFQP